MGSHISPLTKEVGTGRPCSSGLFPLPLPIHLAGSPPPPALAAFAAPPVGASGLVVSGERGWQRKSLAASSVGRGQRWQQGTLERVGGSIKGPQIVLSCSWRGATLWLWPSTGSLPPFVFFPGTQCHSYPDPCL